MRHKDLYHDQDYSSFQLPYVKIQNAIAEIKMQNEILATETYEFNLH